MVYILPVFILVILVIGFVKGVPCFDSFVKGAQNGAMTIVRLVPALVGLIVSIGVFRASVALDLIVEFCRPFMEKIGANSDILPLVLIRPVSGSASLATLRDIIVKCGVDSHVARAACVMMGSTETIFYTMAVYTENTKIRRLPGVLPVALASNLISAIAAGIVCSFV